MSDTSVHDTQEVVRCVRPYIATATASILTAIQCGELARGRTVVESDPARDFFRDSAFRVATELARATTGDSPKEMFAGAMNIGILARLLVILTAEANGASSPHDLCAVVDKAAGDILEEERAR